MQAPHKSEYTYNHDLSALDLSLLIMPPAKRDIALVAAELYLFSLCDHLTVQQPCIEMRPLAAPADRSYLLNIVCKLHKPLCAGEQIIRQKKAVKAAVGRIGGRPHFLYGKLFCGECGEPMTRRTLNGPKGIKHKVWTCRGRHEGRKGNGCKCRNIKENELIAAISKKNVQRTDRRKCCSVMLKKVLIELDDISIEYADNAV